MKYYDKIDGLRFIAIFLVLIEHFAIILGRNFSAGYYGVDLFFVISGFLITSILLKPNEKSFLTNYKNFIGRRTLRIFPIYYLTILILCLFNLEVVRENILWLITYTFNYAIVIYKLPNNPVSHFWSLCVEEQFYLFWPIVILGLKRNKNFLIFIIISIILFGYGQYMFKIFSSINPYNSVGLITRMASLGMGALGAVLVSQKLVPEEFFKNFAIEIFMLLMLAIALMYPFKLKAILLGLCSLYIVIKAANYEFEINVINRFLRNKHIIKIGTLAYGIYIFHLPLSYYFSTYIFDPFWGKIDFDALGPFNKLQWHSWIIKLPLYSFLSYLLAWISYKYIESPILSLKDKYFKY